jgi:esterase/lipase superfamily enzyme
MQQALEAAIASVWDQLSGLAKHHQSGFEDELLRALRALDQAPQDPAKERRVLAVIQGVTGGYDLLLTELARQSPALTKGVARQTGAVSMQRCVRLPVYYATDRLREGGSYSSKRGSLEFGRADVSVPDDRRYGELPKPSLWRLEFRADPKNHMILLGIRQQPLRDWRAEAHAADALVFVHGYNVSFEDAALRAAQFAVDLNFDGTAMLYSWPSEGKVLSYGVDAANADWTVDNFEVFLKTVLGGCGFARIHIVAHSMGNRLMTEGLRRLDTATLPQGSAELAEAIFAAPDVDADTFRKFAAMFHRRANRMTLYASACDKALDMSQRIHRYPRAGDLRDGMVIVEGLDSIDASAVDTSFLGHSYFGDNRSIISDLFNLIRGAKVGERHGLEQRVGLDDAKYWAIKA